MRSMNRQANRMAARRGGILPRKTAALFRARQAGGCTAVEKGMPHHSCSANGVAWASWQGRSLSIYSEAYTVADPSGANEHCHEVYFDKYKEKLKCGTTTKVE